MTIELRDLLTGTALEASEREEFFQKRGFRKPAEADQDLASIAKTLLPEERHLGVLERLLDSLGSGIDPDLGLSNLERFLAELTDPQPLLRALDRDSGLSQRLALVLGGSPFLARVLIRHPDYVRLFEPDEIRAVRDRPWFLGEARAAVADGPSRRDRLEALHHYQHRELLRIGYLELASAAPLEEIARQLSWLADAVVQVVVEEAMRETEPAELGFAVIGLGKLGGEELNFSSDIDVLYIYSDEEKADSATRLARRVHRYLTDPTAASVFYRVDLRLRPGGGGGPLASSLVSLGTYYESWGETFERLALSKARCIAGDPESGREFLEIAQPFIYRRYLDYAAIDEVGAIKRRIDQQASSKGELERNVKLGPGGIREIEFFVQALQVLYGGDLPRLRVSSTLVALDRLVETELIDPETGRGLQQAYRFLRSVEHKLQVLEQRQTHTLPEDALEFDRCARRMGMSGDGFREALDRHRGFVGRVFGMLFSDGESSERREVTWVHRFVNGVAGREETLEWLASRGLADPQQALDILASLRDAPAFGHSPSRMKNLLANVMPPLLNAASRSIRSERVLTGFERLTSSMGARESFFTSLLEAPGAIGRLARVFDLSEPLSDFLIRRPGSSEVLIDVDRIPGTRGLLDTDSRSMLEFYLGIGFLLGKASRIRVSRLLSRFAEKTLRGHLPESAPIAVFALGKFGERELSFRSDLDVVAFYSGDYSGACDCLEGLVAALETDYKVDLRLRPEGRKGSMVWDLESTTAYLDERAEPWERLAWTKARFVAGDRGLAGRFLPVLEDFVFGSDLAGEDIRRVKQIRGRMERELADEAEGTRNLKLGYGGLVDLEFLAQFLQIRRGIRAPSTAYVLRRPGVDPALFPAYMFLRNLEAAVRLMRTLSTTRFGEGDLPVLEAILDRTDLAESYRETTRRVRQAFDAYAG